MVTAVWQRISVSDIVKSPEVTTSNMENYMSESNKPTGENKPQPTTQNKSDTKAGPPPLRDFSMGRTITGDSAPISGDALQNLTRKNTPVQKR